MSRPTATRTSRCFAPSPSSYGPPRSSPRFWSPDAAPASRFKPAVRLNGRRASSRHSRATSDDDTNAECGISRRGRALHDAYPDIPHYALRIPHLTPVPQDLAEVYRTTYRALVRFLYRKVWDAERAEDLAQEAFARAVIHKPDNARGWLFIVAANDRKSTRLN